MNYYKRHIGDYAKKAGHLSVLEHGVYTLLLDSYYAREQAPTRAEALRITRARSPEEIAALDAVLTDFFTEVDGRYRQSRVEEEFVKAEEVAKANRENGRKGGRPRKPKGNRTVTHSVTNGNRTESENNPNPLIHQSTNLEASGQAPITAMAAVSEAGRACKLMREAGCTQSNPSNPDLLAALAEGVTAEALADTVREGVEAGKSKPFAWAIAAARSRHAEGARAVSTGPPRNGHSPSKQHTAIAALLGKSHESTEPADLVCDRDTPRLSNASRA